MTSYSVVEEVSPVLPFVILAIILAMTLVAAILGVDSRPGIDEAPRINI